MNLGQFADSASGAGALGLSFGAFAVQLLTFLIVFLVLKRWAFEPIIRKLAERRELIDSGVTLGEEMKAERAKLAGEIAAQLQKARVDADQVLADAQAAARKVIETAEAAAEVRTEAIVRSAHRQIQITAEHERAQLEGELVHLVSDISGVVIGKKLQAKDDAVLIDNALRARKQP